MFKRIGLLILANFAIFIMLSVILNVISMVTGINFGTMSGKSLNLGALFVFAMVVGFSGSIISLLMSKTMAKMSMGLTMVDVDHREAHRHLRHRLRHQERDDRAREAHHHRKDEERAQVE